MQRGRVLSDSDWNESAVVAAEDLRQARLALIGPKGVPGDGFSILSPVPDIDASGKIGFSLGAGSFYLGGLRFVLESTPVASREFRYQRDFLQIRPRDIPDTPAGDRTDLIYLEGWVQSVGANEESGVS